MKSGQLSFGSIESTLNDVGAPKRLPLCAASWIGIFLFSFSLNGATFTAQSPAEQLRGNFGNRVLGISDLTGDGIGELAVAALQDGVHIDIGAVFILNGQNHSLVRRLDSPDVGVDGGPSWGWSMAELPDLNGNGSPELAVGGPYGDQSSPATIFYGRVDIVDLATGAVLRSFLGPRTHQNSYFGWSLASLTGGQSSLVAVGAPRAVGGIGQVYLFATNGTLIRTINSPVSAANHWFGASVAAISDVDGGGQADLAVGAGRGEIGLAGAAPGAAYIVSSETGALLHQLTPPEISTSVRMRWSVAAVPDVNADGVTDVLVGIPLAAAPGSGVEMGLACLFNGVNGQWLRTLSSPQAQQGGGFGWAVAGLPDITGDGAGDLLIGAGTHAGFGFGTWGERRMYLVNGASGALIRTYASANSGEGFGLSVTPVVDGNQRVRLVASGAPQEEPAPSPQNAGRAYGFTLSFLAVRQGGADLHLSLIGHPRWNYDLEVSPDLKAWTVLTTIEAASEPVLRADGDARQAVRFYRAREVNIAP